MIIHIVLTTAGVDVGPFDIYQWVFPNWSLVAADVDRNTLVIGADYTVDDLATEIEIISTGLCNERLNLTIGTTTTTTTSSTTSTTTTEAPTTTTTTTTDFPCHGYNVNNYSGNPEDFNYVDCNGDVQIESVPATNGYIEVCGRSYTENPNLNIEYVETCVPPTTTTTTTEAPTTSTTTTTTTETPTTTTTTTL